MRSRRALSSVVGMVFAIIALTSTVVYITYSMNTINQYNQSVIGRTQEVQNTAQENFQITGANIVNGKFNITLSNTGTLPVNITKVWVQNTTAKDANGNYWIKSFVPDNKFAMPGNTVTNIGMSFPGQMVSSDGYQIKLVTSRGNMQQFTMSSTNTPLNIQLLAIPPTLPAGFSTQLVMIVTNNSTGVLTNLVPADPEKSPSSTAKTCQLGPVNPPSYDILRVGQTAVFSWALTVEGDPGNTCVYTAKLQNSNQVTSAATVTVNQVTLVPSTTYAEYTGILTINYTTFRWTEGSGWNAGWDLPKSNPAGFSITVTNNNETGSFQISKLSAMFFNSAGSGSSITFYIVNSTSSSLSNTSYDCAYGDFCNSIPPNGHATLYFSATAEQGTAASKFPSASNPYSVSALLYGKFGSQDSTGYSYAQNIPYIAVMTS